MVKNSISSWILDPREQVTFRGCYLPNASADFQCQKDPQDLLRRFCFGKMGIQLTDVPALCNSSVIPVGKTAVLKKVHLGRNGF